MTGKEFKSMPLGRKLIYLFKKYAWEGIFIVYLVSLLGSWIYLDYIEPQPVLRVEMINGSPDSPDSEAFSAFMEEHTMACSDEIVRVSKKIQLRNGPEGFNPNALIFCRAGEGKTDLYFWDDWNVEAALAEYDLIDLRKILSPDELLAIEDRLVYSAPLLRKGFPCGIRLNDCGWIEDNGFYDDCTVGISRNVKNPELIRQFIAYITREISLSVPQ